MRRIMAPALALTLVSTGCKPNEGYSHQESTRKKVEATLGTYEKAEETLKKTHEKIFETNFNESRVFSTMLWISDKKVSVEIIYDESIGRWISELDILRSEKLSSLQTEKILNILMEVDEETNQRWINRGKN